MVNPRAPSPELRLLRLLRLLRATAELGEHAYISGFPWNRAARFLAHIRTYAFALMPPAYFMRHVIVIVIVTRL